MNRWQQIVNQHAAQPMLQSATRRDGKRCGGCGVFLPLDSFYQRQDTKDGYVSKCRTCSMATSKSYRQKVKAEAGGE